MLSFPLADFVLEKGKNMEKQYKKGFIATLPSILGIIICLLVAPILIMNLTIVVKSYINPDKVPDFFGIKPFVVATGSMETAIYGGDLVVTKTVNPAELKVRDIISFKDGNSVVTHRIIQLTEKDGQPAFITKGDANNVEDGNPVTYEQVEGVFVFKVRGLGDLAMFMQTQVGMIVFIGIPLCGFIIYDAIRRRRAEQEARYREQRARAQQTRNF